MSDDGAIRVSLHQPNFLPWTKLFDKILASDVYIAYDSVQYTHSEFHARQWITGRDGPVWLSAPVLTRGRSRQPLDKAELVPGRAWRDAHLRLLTEHYRHAPHFRGVMAVLESVYDRDDHLLVDLNLPLVDALPRSSGRACRWPGCLLRAPGGNTERVIQLTQAVGGNYSDLTSTYGTPRQYIDWKRVAAAGIAVESQRFTEPCYRQQFEPSGRICRWSIAVRAGPAARGCSPSCAGSTGCSRRLPGR